MKKILLIFIFILLIPSLTFSESIKSLYIKGPVNDKNPKCVLRDVGENWLAGKYIKHGRQTSEDTCTVSMTQEEFLRDFKYCSLSGIRKHSNTSILNTSAGSSYECTVLYNGLYVVFEATMEINNDTHLRCDFACITKNRLK